MNRWVGAAPDSLPPPGTRGLHAKLDRKEGSLVGPVSTVQDLSR